jgi:Ni/Co efflux regulator RcnB
MKKSILLAVLAVAMLAAPVTFANGSSKKQTPKQAAKTEKKEAKIVAKTERKEAKTEMKVAKHSRHHKAKKAA